MSEPAPHDLLGIALRTYDRVMYCRCGDGGLTAAYAVRLHPIILFEPHPNQYTRLFDSRQLAVLDESSTEREVRRALRGVGLERQR